MNNLSRRIIKLFSTNRSLNWIYYDARNHNDTKYSNTRKYHPDCQLRAWSKALGIDYRDLAFKLGMPDPDHLCQGEYRPYFRYGQSGLDKNTAKLDQNKYNKWDSINRNNRRTTEFPPHTQWHMYPLGRYVKDYKLENGDNKHRLSESDKEDLDMWCLEHPSGTYVVGLDCSTDPQFKKLAQGSGHAVAVIDGKFYDTWDSGKCMVDSYWEINTNKIMLDNKDKNKDKKGNLFN